MAVPLFTVGHSNHPIEHFLGLLRRHGVEAVADVRSRPYSRFVPHFNKNQLERRLAEEGIGYLYLGRELGGKSPVGARRSGATTGGCPGEPAAPSPAPDYRARIGEPAFREGIERLLDAANEQPIALMCRERDPLDCHRLHLICRHLAPMALDVRHILADGAIEEQAATEQRLTGPAGQGTLPLLEPNDPLARAYDQWWQRGR